MSQAIAIRPETTMDEWSIIREQSAVLVKTGFLPQSIKTPEQAMAIILTGRELGIGTMAALNTINVIQGKPTISPQLMLALINRSGQLENIEIKGDAETGVTCTMKRKGRTAHSSHFGPREAAAMGLHSKDNYKKQPATMYKWRSVADCSRAVFPDVILGLYTPEEMGASVNADGEVIDAPAPVVSIVQDQPVIDAEPVTERAPDLITEQQMGDLTFLLDELSNRGIEDELILAGINKLAGMHFDNLEPDLLATMTNAQAAKVVSAYSRKLDELIAKESK